MSKPLDRGDRTYYVSDERLREFQKLTPLEKLRWQEEIGAFLRLAKIGTKTAQEISPNAGTPLPSASPKS